MLQKTTLDTPIGRLTVVASAAGLCRIYFPAEGIASSLAREFPAQSVVPDAGFCRAAVQQLQEYFSGHRTRFTLELDLRVTPFFRRVLQAVAEIPYGQTASYSDIARQIGKPRAVRAVGLANARNPVPIVIPCHRVVGKNGALVGYGGGLSTKQWLLDWERTHRI